MADQSDVEQALVLAIAAALYPTGVPGGDPPLSVLNCGARVGRGWPNETALDADLRASILNVSVYPRNGVERNTTRFAATWQEGAVSPTTLTLTQVGGVVTVGGAQPAPFYLHNFAIMVDGHVFLFETGSTDTPSTIAAALGAEINAAIGGVTVSGAAITLPATANVTALEVGTVGQMTREVSRQEKQFQVTIWAFNPVIRDQAASLLKPTLDATEFLTLADGSSARLVYAMSYQTDAPEKEILYRRDLIYLIEWATLQVQTISQVVATTVATAAGQDGQTAPVVATTENA